MLVCLVNLPNRDVTGRVATCHLWLQNPLIHGAVHGTGVLQNTLRDILSPLGLSFSNSASRSLLGQKITCRGSVKKMWLAMTKLNKALVPLLEYLLTPHHKLRIWVWNKKKERKDIHILRKHWPSSELTNSEIIVRRHIYLSPHRILFS